MDIILMHHASLEIKDTVSTIALIRFLYFFIDFLLQRGVTAVHLAAKLPKPSTLEIYLARCPHMISWVDEVFCCIVEIMDLKIRSFFRTIKHHCIMRLVPEVGRPLSSCWDKVQRWMLSPKMENQLYCMLLR